MSDPAPATKQCPYCAETIQAAAVVCRFCQRDLPEAKPVIAPPPPPTPEQTRENLRILGIVILAIVALCGTFWFTGGSRSGSGASPSRPTATPDGRAMAWVMCQQFVEKSLKAPSTAEWPFSYASDGVSVTALDKTRWRVRGWVDAQNSFGAQVRTNFTCTLSNTSGDNWRLDDLMTS